MNRIRTLSAWCLLASCALLGTGAAANEANACRTPASPDAARHALVVSGLGGEEHYSSRFWRWATDFAELAVERGAFERGCVRVLTEQRDAASDVVNGESTKEAILRELAAISARSEAGDLVLVLFIGHGTARGTAARFNIPGPDLTARELDDALLALDGRRLVIVVGTSASGAFMPALRGQDRIVITATASANENRASRFAGAFVDAMGAPEADTDKNQRLSLAEAFEYAVHQVAKIYESKRQLQTEHAMMDDSADGQLAATTYLHEADENVGPASSPRVLALRRDTRELLDEIETLKFSKRGLGEQEYLGSLEALLLRLALTRRELRELQSP